MPSLRRLGSAIQSTRPLTHASVMRMAVMSMICATAAVALFVGYRGLFEMLAARWVSGVVCVAVSFLAGAAAFQLCKHRNDLI